MLSTDPTTLARDYATTAARRAAHAAREADLLARSIIRITADPRTMDAAAALAIRVGEAAVIALDFAVEAQTSSRASWLCDLAQDASSLAHDLWDELQLLGHRAVAQRSQTGNAK